MTTAQWYKTEARKVMKKPKSKRTDRDRLILSVRRQDVKDAILMPILFPVMLVVKLYKWTYNLDN